MIINVKQRKIKIGPRIKLNYSIYTTLVVVSTTGRYRGHQERVGRFYNADSYTGKSRFFGEGYVLLKSASNEGVKFMSLR